jgi:hypothetical protein
MTGVLPHVKNLFDSRGTAEHDLLDGRGMVGIDEFPDVGGVVDLDAPDLFREPAGSDLVPAARVPAETEGPLTERQREMLRFERTWWRHAGSKEQAIRENFDLSATRYYQMLNRLLDRPEALEFDPIVVGRLRRLRATRARTRSR